jgi:cell division septation protein DedD
LTSHPTDDGFHEIQLNGKQLVFLFMAATVVSVVIFLCGVLVGRGVRAERGGPDTALADLPLADQAMPTAGSASEATDIRSAAPPAAVDDRPTLFDRLEKSDQALDDLKAPAAKAPPAKAPASESRQAQAQRDVPPAPPPVTKAPTTVAVTTPPPTAKPAPAPPKPAALPASKPAPPTAAAADTKPAGDTKPGYAVQLAALNSRSEADAMAKRLNAKGYEAYVQGPAGNAPGKPTFRVRVGNYTTRSEAETVAAKLEKEGQFTPWVAAPPR